VEVAVAERPPTISIDDALQLFLQLVKPSGLEDGPEKVALLEHMRARVAADRPQWADASQPPPPPCQAQPEYAQTKATIVAAAQADELPPSDPLERAMWEERRQARENAEQRRADAREAEARERLRQQAIVDKREVDDATLERALRIRSMIELKLQALAAPSTSLPTTPSPSIELAAASMTPTLERSEIQFASEPEPTQVTFTSTERIELLRAYNAERRALLHTREGLLAARGLDHRKDDDERMQMPTEKQAVVDRASLTMESRPNKRTRTWDLQLE
jgi:hypothetical protein